MSDYSELSEEAFEDSPQYEFKGIPLYFSYRHYYALLAIMAEAEMCAEEQILLIFWVATHTPEEIKKLRQTWRKDKDQVFDDFEIVPEKFNLKPGSNDLIECASIANKIWNDVESSKDEIKEQETSDGTKTNSPKK